MSEPHYLANTVHLGKTHLTVDGVTLPWFIGPEVEVETGDSPYLYGLNVTLLARRVVVDGAAMKRDTLLENAREEALAIVRSGLADVLEWLGETP